MEERSHLAIGEVLTLLREEFPDVTISKIRFLESQGLVDPERTPSGYRKFYDADVARLRWILLQQKENFLPLKVIKDRLGELDAAGRTDFATAPSGGAPGRAQAATGAPAVTTEAATSEAATTEVSAAGDEPAEPGLATTASPPSAGPGGEASQAPLHLDPSAPAGSENGANPEVASADAGSVAKTAPDSPATPHAAADQAAVGPPATGPAATGPAVPGPASEGPASEGAGAEGGGAPSAPRERMPSGAAGTGPNFARRSILGSPPVGSPQPSRPRRPESGPAERGPSVGGGPERRPAERARAWERGRTESPALAEAPARERAEGRGPASRPAPSDPAVTAPAPGRQVGMSPPEAETLTLVELAAAAGIDVAAVQQLQQFGLIVPTGAVGGTTYFDGLALEVARSAAAFSRHGIEARHLRAWRNSAEREASLFEQVIMPLVRQRNPHARELADATLDELAGLGADLRAALLRQALRSLR